MGGILLINLVMIGLLYKELKLSTFDAGLALALGFSPVLLHYGLMALVSVTIVGAFNITGSVLVVALVVAPAATAYLLTDRLSGMLVISAILGIVGAVGGYWLAFLFDASIAGSIASMLGILFTLALLLAPERGLIANVMRRARQKREFAITLLAGHLLNHETSPEASVENRLEHLGDHLRWAPEFAQRVVHESQQAGIITLEGSLLRLTPEGRSRARSSLLF
jgi:manganese/zinc/iron transport system permease protein